MEPMEKDELIQQQMADTRAALADKLETLEQKVVGTVTDATTAVNETVDVIKESVQGTVTAVNETVKESVETVKDWFDVPAHVREHPWLAVGGSVAAGYCLGMMLGKNSQVAASPPMPTYPWMNQSSNGGGQAERPTPETQNPIKTALSNWAPEIDKLKGLALGVLFGTARELIASSVSENVGEQLRGIIDSATKKVGGEPIPSADWANKPQEAPTVDARREDSDETAAQWQARQGATQPAARRW